MTSLLHLGEPAPWFHAAALDGNPRYAFDTVAGRYVLLLLAGSTRAVAARDALQLIEANRGLFDDDNAAFFGVTVDPTDAEQARVAQRLPGIRWFLDYDRAVSRKFGAIETIRGEDVYRPHWLLLDPMLRVKCRAEMTHGRMIMETLRNVVAAANQSPASNAPVLVLPRVIEPEMCRHLIALYEQHGGEESGFMREENGRTVTKLDHAHKRRSDYIIEDANLVKALKLRMARVMNPMLKRAFQFDATRIERFIVACYDGSSGGHFRAHRDNTTKGTAHRKFACTINLNAEEYKGGDLQFPEFGRRTYRAPTGGAVLFSCSLLHQANPVTKGRRYAFLPFLYDDEGARIRERNLAFVEPRLQDYRSGLGGREDAEPNI
jgi:predicted 2-oxoglutarate/Fe(II)-dependent dioxygenase YbiX